MSRLVELIDEYKGRHGNPSDASIARAIGVAPQTISAWRRRGIKEMPNADTMRRLAEFIKVADTDVFYAAGVDAGFIVETVVSDEELVRRRVEEWRAAAVEGIPDADTGSA